MKYVNNSESERKAIKWPRGILHEKCDKKNKKQNRMIDWRGN